MLIKFNEMKVLDNGAQFFKVDLHVHSFGASPDVKDSLMTVEAIIDEAVKLDIRILAITDHNTDVNTQKSIDYSIQYAGQILVLAGVEITTSNGHLLVYFAPAQAVNVGKLLGKINIVDRFGEQDGRTEMCMADVIKQAELLGGICVAAHIDRLKSGFEALVAGYPSWKKDILMSPGLYGLEFDDLTNLIWYSDADEPTSNGAERGKIISARATVPALKKRPCLAHIQGSDSHTLENFISGRAGKMLTRFKLTQPSYEAFRVALTDPSAYIRVGATISH